MMPGLKLSAPHLDTKCPAMPASDGVTMFGFASALTQAMSQPLTAIAAEIATLRALLANETVEMRDTFERLKNASDRARGDVLGARAVLRATANRNGAIDMNDVLRDAAIRLASTINNTRLDIRLDLDHGLPLVPANRSQIERVVWEALTNAAEQALARPEREQVIEVLSRTRGEDVHVEIVDRAGGVEDAERIFDIFFTTKDGHPGVGLGIARSLAVVNGGQLWAQAAPHGTRVILSLPLSYGA